MTLPSDKILTIISEENIGIFKLRKNIILNGKTIIKSQNPISFQEENHIYIQAENIFSNQIQREICFEYFPPQCNRITFIPSTDSFFLQFNCTEPRNTLLTPIQICGEIQPIPSTTFPPTPSPTPSLILSPTPSPTPYLTTPLIPVLTIEKHEKLNNSILIGLLVPFGLIFVFILTLAIFILYHKRKKKQQQNVNDISLIPFDQNIYESIGYIYNSNSDKDKWIVNFKEIKVVKELGRGAFGML